MFVWSIVHIFRILGLNFVKHFFLDLVAFLGCFSPFCFWGPGHSHNKRYIFDDQALTTGAFSNDNEEFVQDIENFEL